jgi:CTP:molybdopterin cytidylyltransferase MocA
MLSQPISKNPINQIFTVILAIPARLGSSRLPRKLAAEIGGKPMLGHVLERCLQATTAHATAGLIKSFSTSWALADASPSPAAP